MRNGVLPCCSSKVSRVEISAVRSLRNLDINSGGLEVASPSPCVEFLGTCQSHHRLLSGYPGSSRHNLSKNRVVQVKGPLVSGDNQPRLGHTRSTASFQNIVSHPLLRVHVSPSVPTSISNTEKGSWAVHILQDTCVHAFLCEQPCCFRALHSNDIPDIMSSVT